MPLRVLHLCSSRVAARWLCAFLPYLRACGHDISVVVRRNSPIQTEISDLGLRCHVLDHEVLSPGSPLGAARRLMALASLLRRERPDILHSHLFQSNIAGRLAGWLADVPIRLSMNAGPYSLESPTLSAIEVITAGTETRIIASCDHVRRLYVQRGVPPQQIELVYYGAEAATFTPDPARAAAIRAELGVEPQTPLVGMVAHFYPPARPESAAPPLLWGRGLKGHDVLLRAIPAVLTRMPGVRFVLAGDAWDERGRTYLRDLQATADALGIRSSLLFIGNRTDVPDLLSTFDVALQCSLSENLGGTVEALLSAAPLIVSRTGGMVETVRHDDTGLVVPPDDPDALADAILALLTDRARARRLGDAGRALMLERFTAERTGADLDALYRRLAADPSFSGAPPHKAGYRRARSVARWSRLPWLAWQIRMVVADTGGLGGPRSPDVR